MKIRSENNQSIEKHKVKGKVLRNSGKKNPYYNTYLINYFTEMWTLKYSYQTFSTDILSN